MKGFVFDVDDTLYDQLVPFERAFHQVFPTLNEMSMHRLYKETRKISDYYFPQLSQGLISFSEVNQRRIQEGMAKFGQTISRTEANRFQAHYLQAQKEIELQPAMRQSLCLLKKAQVPVAVITNGPAEHQRMKLRQLGIAAFIPAENWFISGEVGLAKPASGIFEQTAEFLQMTPEQLYYIGDSYQNDVLGAQTAGWSSIWLNVRKNECKIVVKQPTHQLTSWNEVPDLLASLLIEMETD